MSLLAEAMSEHFNPEKKVEDENVENKVEETTAETVVEAPLEPVVEQTTGDISFVSDEVTEVAPVETTENQVQSEFVLNDEPTFDISKHTNGEFNKIEDLLNSYNELKNNVITGDTALEMLNKQCEEQYGMSYADVVAWKNIDYNSMNEFDVLAEYEEFRDPEVTDIEIQSALREFEVLGKTKEQQQEMIDDGEITARDLELLQVKYNKQVRIARKELSEHRDSLGFENIKLGLNQAKAEVKASPTAEDIQATKKLINDDLKSLQTLRMNLGSKDAPQNLDFKPTDDERSLLADTISNPNWLGDRWNNEDGSFNKNLAYRDAYVLMNLSKMLKAAHNEGLVRGTRNHVVNEDNITLKDGRQVTNNGTVDPLQALADKYGANY